MDVLSGINQMTFSTVAIDPTGVDQLANGLTGFSDEAEKLLRNSMMTTIFIGGASAQSQGRCSYMLGDDGARLWLPNTLCCWITDLALVTQTYESFDPQEKLLVAVTASDGTNWIYRMGFNSWTATSFLVCLKSMSKQQHAEQVQITLTAKGRATFVSIACIQSDLSNFQRVSIAKEDLGRKLGYDECLDVVTYVNQQAQSNQGSHKVLEQIDQENLAFEPVPEELDQLIEDIKQPRRKRQKSDSNKA